MGYLKMRERFICVGVREDFGERFLFPEPTHYNPDKEVELFERKPWVTCGEAIGDLDYDLPIDSEMEADQNIKNY